MNLAVLLRILLTLPGFRIYFEPLTLSGYMIYFEPLTLPGFRIYPVPESDSGISFSKFSVE
jgi:hypothetical protein